IGSEGVAKRIGMHWREPSEFMGHKVNVYAKVL
ncbi:MAG: GNAT family N-acetyltransferase, partial [Shewanella sp.]